jgi:hypothetical protein
MRLQYGPGSPPPPLLLPPLPGGRPSAMHSVGSRTSDKGQLAGA